MLQKIGAVSYKLDPPPESKIIHPVFHVLYLKLKLGQQVTPIPTLPPIDESGQITTEPMALLQSRTRTLRSRTIAAISTILSSPCGHCILLTNTGVLYCIVIGVTDCAKLAGLVS